MPENRHATSGLRDVLAHNAATRPDTAFRQSLRSALPQFFDRDGVFLREKFDAELRASNIAEAHDGYRLGFVGKDYARLQTGLVAETLLVPDLSHNARPENAASGNIFITGDNLEALRHLVNAYENQVKLIYIDPPYNTGQEFTYSDKFEFSDEKLKNILGCTDEEIARLKSIQGKSSHSAWLTFMYPRLKLAQKLLRDDGVIFVSIDDNEQADLKLLMDDIFGEGNFVSTVPRIAKRTSDKGTHFKPTKDYLICFAKNIASLLEFGISKIRDEKEYDLFDKDGRRYKKSGASLYQPSLDSRPNQRYYIEAPDGSLIIPPGNVFPDRKKDASKVRPESNADKVWRWSVDTYLKQKHLLIFTKGSTQNPLLDENGNKSQWNIYPKVYFDEDVDATLHPEDVIYDFLNSHAAKELNALEIPFDFAKPSGLIKFLINLINDKEMIILDFFAGSGTTAHAVMQLNAEDGGNRKYIMAQWAEKTPKESEARKAGFETIDAIALKRIQLAAQKIKSENATTLPANFDYGFRHYRLAAPPENLLEKIETFTPDENLVSEDIIAHIEGGANTLLATWLLDDGNMFDQKPEEKVFAGYKAHYTKGTGTLYLINQGWETKALKALLNQIGKNEMQVSTIVVYAFSFGFEALRELKTNVKSALENPPAIQERY